VVQIRRGRADDSGFCERLAPGIAVKPQDRYGLGDFAGLQRYLSLGAPPRDAPPVLTGELLAAAAQVDKGTL
jgi:hypothetical protein